MSLDFPSTLRVGELEWPEEVVGLLEVRTAGDDFVDEIFNAVDTLLGKFTSDDGVIRKRKSASVNFTVTSLVDKVGDGGSGWETVGDERLNDSDHVPGSFVKLNEDGVVDLSKSKELEDLLWLRGKLVDTKK